MTYNTNYIAIMYRASNIYRIHRNFEVKKHLIIVLSSMTWWSQNYNCIQNTAAHTFSQRRIIKVVDVHHFWCCERKGAMHHGMLLSVCLPNTMFDHAESLVRTDPRYNCHHICRTYIDTPGFLVSHFTLLFLRSNVQIKTCDVE